MNIKLHTPTTLKSGSGMKTFKQFLLSILATTVSIILTFGTAAIIDYQKKKAAKKEMTMMIISDFDKTIEMVEKVDTSLLECRRLQNEIATHPETFDELHFGFAGKMAWVLDEFPETTEKIFSTSIETFNIINDVNFVNEVSTFYLERRRYKTMFMDEFEEQWLNSEVIKSLDSLLNFSFPEYVYLNRSFLVSFRATRDRCMQMMDVSESDLAAFNKKRTQKVRDEKSKAQHDDSLDEFMKYEEALEQAKEKLKKK
jgi:hypothetical protein